MTVSTVHSPATVPNLEHRLGHRVLVVVNGAMAVHTQNPQLDNDSTVPSVTDQHTPIWGLAEAKDNTYVFAIANWDHVNGLDPASAHVIASAAKIAAGEYLPLHVFLERTGSITRQLSIGAFGALEQALDRFNRAHDGERRVLAGKELAAPTSTPLPQALLFQRFAQEENTDTAEKHMALLDQTFTLAHTRHTRALASGSTLAFETTMIDCSFNRREQRHSYQSAHLELQVRDIVTDRI